MSDLYTRTNCNHIARNHLGVRLQNNPLGLSVETMLAGIVEAIDLDFTNFIRSWNIELAHIHDTAESETTKNIVSSLQKGIYQFSEMIIFLNESLLNRPKGDGNE